jgi:DNA-binding response OmpR family regulator
MGWTTIRVPMSQSQKAMIVALELFWPVDLKLSCEPEPDLKVHEIDISNVLPRTAEEGLKAGGIDVISSRPKTEGKISYGGVEIDLDQHIVHVNPQWDLKTIVGYDPRQPVGLSTREFDLLRYLMENPRLALSRRQIYDNVWGVDLTNVSNSLDVTIGTLRRKLAYAGAPQLIHTVRGIGYRLHLPDDYKLRDA